MTCRVYHSHFFVRNLRWGFHCRAIDDFSYPTPSSWNFPGYRKFPQSLPNHTGCYRGPLSLTITNHCYTLHCIHYIQKTKKITCNFFMLSLQAVYPLFPSQACNLLCHWITELSKGKLCTEPSGFFASSNNQLPVTLRQKD